MLEIGGFILLSRRVRISDHLAWIVHAGRSGLSNWTCI